MPGDPRTIQYLGVAHMDLMDVELGDYVQEAVQRKDPNARHVYEAIRYFKMRSEMTKGSSEERWFSWVLAGKVCKRMGDRRCSIDMWHNASKFDPLRVESWLYLGILHRESKQHNLAFYFLKKALALTIPDRSLHLHDYLYTCTRHVDFAKAVAEDPDSSWNDWLLAKVSLEAAKQAPCKGREKGDMDELYVTASARLQDKKLPKSRKKTGSKSSGSDTEEDGPSKKDKKKKKKSKSEKDGKTKKKKKTKKGKAGLADTIAEHEDPSPNVAHTEL
mmetsp:Transcript_39525/g.61626  ORF Transcript_39525/g.61626 Transcript_39525/m.61626 type:complete len:275 (-) Transcript_39525:1114-1938(-)